MILPDTSVWIDYLRATPSSRTGLSASPAEELDTLIQDEQIVICGPIIAELMAGARGRQRDELAQQLGAHPWIDIKHADWLAVGHAAATLQERGQMTPLIDIQIAVCAISAKAELWTLDRDFERIAENLDDLRIRIFE
ncbi:MAG TPA: PIN domain-containing protein [Solirubrobacteraceae bacterium]|nr:PIN domain-containing protein [Solirubrobacteraceae bacterium]